MLVNAGDVCFEKKKWGGLWRLIMSWIPLCFSQILVKSTTRVLYLHPTYAHIQIKLFCNDQSWIMSSVKEVQLFCMDEYPRFLSACLLILVDITESISGVILFRGITLNFTPPYLLSFSNLFISVRVTMNPEPIPGKLRMKKEYALDETHTCTTILVWLVDLMHSPTPYLSLNHYN